MNLIKIEYIMFFLVPFFSVFVFMNGPARRGAFKGWWNMENFCNEFDKSQRKIRISPFLLPFNYCSFFVVFNCKNPSIQPRTSLSKFEVDLEGNWKFWGEKIQRKFQKTGIRNASPGADTATRSCSDVVWSRSAMHAADHPQVRMPKTLLAATCIHLLFILSSNQNGAILKGPLSTALMRMFQVVSCGVRNSARSLCSCNLPSKLIYQFRILDGKLQKNAFF